MRGRDIFALFRGPIRFAVFWYSSIPRWRRLWIWNTTDSYPEFLGYFVRYCLLKSLSLECGENVKIGRGVTLVMPERISIGRNVSIHANCYIDGTGGVMIGDNVSLAHHTSILSFEHTWSDPGVPIRDQAPVLKPTTLGSNVWVGCGARILGGSTIESRSIVAAGAVVKGRVESGSIVGGVPAKVLKEL